MKVKLNVLTYDWVPSCQPPDGTFGLSDNPTDENDVDIVISRKKWKRILKNLVEDRPIMITDSRGLLTGEIANGKHYFFPLDDSEILGALVRACVDDTTAGQFIKYISMRRKR